MHVVSQHLRLILLVHKTKIIYFVTSRYPEVTCFHLELLPSDMQYFSRSTLKILQLDEHHSTTSESTTKFLRLRLTAPITNILFCQDNSARVRMGFSLRHPLVLSQTSCRIQKIFAQTRSQFCLKLPTMMDLHHLLLLCVLMSKNGGLEGHLPTRAQPASRLIMMSTILLHCEWLFWCSSS